MVQSLSHSHHFLCSSSIGLSHADGRLSYFYDDGLVILPVLIGYELSTIQVVTRTFYHFIACYSLG